MKYRMTANPFLRLALFAALLAAPLAAPLAASAASCTCLCFLYKVTAIMRFGSVIKVLPPCSASIIHPVHFVFLAVQYLMGISQYPSSKKLKKVAPATTTTR